MSANHSNANRPDDDNQDQHRQDHNRNESIDPYFSIKTEAPVRFTSWHGNEYPVTLTNITYRGERGDHGEEPIIKIIITMFIQAGVMKQLLADQSFHAWPHTFISPAHFEEKEPIEIKAMLDPALAKQIEKQSGDAESVLAALLPSETGISKMTPLTHSEYWYLLQAMQTITLPPELQQTGKVRQGFRTIWQRVLTEPIEAFPSQSGFMPVSSSPSSPGNIVLSETSNPYLSQAALDDDRLKHGAHLLAKVEHVLKTEELLYERFSEDIIRIPFRDEKGRWVLLIRYDQELKLLNLYSVFPDRIPASKRPQIALMLINEHYNFTIGNFEMDIEDGEVRFRSTLNFNAGWDDEIFRSLLSDHLKIVEVYFPLLQHLQ